MQARHQRREIVNVLDRLHLVERRLHGFGAKLLDSGFIHASGVVVADLLGDGIAVLGRAMPVRECPADKRDYLRTACE